MSKISERSSVAQLALQPLLNQVRSELNEQEGAPPCPTSILERSGARQAGHRWKLTAAAIVVACAAAGFLLRATSARNQLLEYEVSGASVTASGYVRPRGIAAQVLFSDGSRVRVSPSAVARVTALHKDGADLALESGQLHVHVVHQPGAHWSIFAGPFEVRVTGTEFDVEWTPARDELVLEMQSGSVVVNGPNAADHWSVARRQRLTVSLQNGTPVVRVSDQHGLSDAGFPVPEPKPVPVPIAKVAPSAAPLAGAPRVAEVRPVPNAAQPSWAALLRQGKPRTVVELAESTGLEVCYATSTISDLSALADSGRFTGRLEVARRAWSAQRSRFPGSLAAKEAAFLLGRMAEDAGGSRAEAVEWYSRYLIESPSGSFAAEALGRKLTAVAQLPGQKAQAAELARRYLSLYPKGAYAGAADGILKR